MHTHSMYYIQCKLTIHIHIVLYRCVHFHWKVALQEAEQDLLGEGDEALGQASAKHLI